MLYRQYKSLATAANGYAMADQVSLNSVVENATREYLKTVSYVLLAWDRAEIV